MSINGGDLERFWPRFTFTNDSDLTSERNHNSGMCGDSHRLCKNLASLSQMSLTNPTCSPTCLYGNNGLHHDEEAEVLLSLLHSNNNGNLMTQNSVTSPRAANPSENIQKTTNSAQRPKSSSKTLTPSIKVPNPPVLSDESIFKIPVNSAPKKSNGNLKSQRDTSESEQESLTIPPMKLLDLTPITNNSSHENICPTSNTTAVKQSPVIVSNPVRGCDHSHHFNNGNNNGIPKLNGGSGGSSSGSSHQTLTPPTSPSIVTISPEILTKSPSKSKSRKIAKFFRTRSKSPKTAGATSSSESGKSSGSSSVSAETSSGGSSYSAAAPPSTLIPTPINKSKPGCNNNSIKSPKHSSPSKKSKAKNQNVLSSQPESDYHFTCDSVLPMFLPNSMQLSKETESGKGKNKLN